MGCNHTCAVILSYEVYDSPRSSLEREWISMRTSRDTWCNHMCAMTLSFVCSDAFICAHWLVYSSDVTFWCEPTWISIWTCDTWLTHFMFKLRWSEMVLSLDMKNGLGRRFLEFVVFNVSFEHDTCDSLDNVDQEYHIMHQGRAAGCNTASVVLSRLVDLTPWGQPSPAPLSGQSRPTNVACQALRGPSKLQQIPIKQWPQKRNIWHFFTTRCTTRSTTRSDLNQVHDWKMLWISINSLPLQVYQKSVETHTIQTMTFWIADGLITFCVCSHDNKSLTLVECALNSQKASMKLLLFLDYA